jgi:hypothetical protein
MLSAADRNPDGEQADYEQALDRFARLVLKDRETWNRKPPDSRGRLAQALVQSQIIGGSGPDPLATAALLCEYLVLGGEEPELVAGAFADHARTLPIPSEYLNSAHWPVLHVVGAWAERKSEEDVRAAVVAAGGEVFRFIYENGNRALDALDLADHVRRLPAEDAPPAELILLPYREWLMVLPASRIPQYQSIREAVRDSVTHGELAERYAKFPGWYRRQYALLHPADQPEWTITDERRERYHLPNAITEAERWMRDLLEPFRRVHPCIPVHHEYTVPADREQWLRRELEHVGYSFVREVPGMSEAFPELSRLGLLPGPPLEPDPFWAEKEAQAALDSLPYLPPLKERTDGQAFEPVVYDEFNGGLVFIPKSEAERLAWLNDALEESRTWGEFYARVRDDDDTQEYLAYQYEDERPDPDQPFDAEDLMGPSEGDWPAWPNQKMLDWLPDSVLALGDHGRSAVSGPMVEFDPRSLRDVIDACAAEGIRCVEDDDGLVTRACGAWRYGM